MKGSVSVCPCCQRPIRAPRPKQTATAITVNTAAMSTEELYAHFKRTAPAEDVAFFQRQRLSPAVRTAASELAAEMRERPIARPEVYRRLTALQDRWRAEDYWRRVLLPAERIARRLAKARSRWTRATRWKVAA